MSKRALAAVVLLVTTSVAFAGFLGGRSEAAARPTATAALSSPADALRAAEILLSSTVKDWEGQATLVERAEDLAAVAPQFPAEGLSPKGFPGPVWVVDVTATLEDGGQRVSFQDIFEARTGEPMVVGAGGWTRYGPS